MSLKIKLPFFVFAMLLINILMLGGYFRFFLSNQISEDNNKAQQELQEKTDHIASELKSRPDVEQQLKDFADSQHFVVEIVDENGKVLFKEGTQSDSSVDHWASSLLVYNGQVRMMRVIEPVQLSYSKISAYESARSLLSAEIVILCLILPLSGVIFYFYYVRPILSLQKKMEHYRSGIRPGRSARLDEIGHLQNRFADLTDEIEEEKEKQNRIIASISHDIKTPLTSVMGYTEQLKKKSLPPKKHEHYVDIIYQKAVAIKTLIEEFDEYLSFHVQSSLKRQSITVDKLVLLLKADYEEELKESGATFSVHNNCPKSALLIDIPKMRRVFGNLIDNSLKHQSGQPPQISVSCMYKKNAVLFSVEDNGTGVPNAEELKKIFDPFYTSDTARTFAGLGLSICREIVEAHGGQIWAENRPSGGLCIFISLPADSLAKNMQ